MALEKPVPSERNRKDTDVRAPKAEIDFDIAGPSSLTPKKPITKQKRKDTDGKAPEALNTRSSSNTKWGNEEDENREKKNFKSDNGRRPGKKSDDQGSQVNNFDDFILRSKLTFSRKMERRGRGMMTMNKK